jgi:RNA polymerase sigma factor (TIGR02999 family)
MNDLSQIPCAATSTDPRGAEQLLPLVYRELRRLAAKRLAREGGAQTLEPTALVHEAYLRLVAGEADSDWNSRGHFFAAAAEAMRRILVERARHKRSLKAGGGYRRQDLSDIQPAAGGKDFDLLALNDALDTLAKQSPRQAELVKLRFFVGLTIEEAAEVLSVSTSTAENDWAHARCWLRVEMDAGRSADHP